MEELMTLDFSKVYLRKILMEDEEEIYEFASDEKVLRYLTWNGIEEYSKTKSFMKYYFVGSKSMLAIVHKETEKCIGLFETIKDKSRGSVRIGFLLNSKFWNQGIMTEMVNKIVDFCFEKLGISEIEASHIAQNLACGKVLNNAGLEIDSKIHQRVKIKGELQEVIYYSLTKEKYEKTKATKKEDGA